MSRMSLIYVACACAVLGACSKGSERPADESSEEARGTTATATADNEAEETARASAPQEVTAIARDFTFELRGPIPAGVTTVRLANEGKVMHHMQLYRLEEGKSTPDLLQAIKASMEGAAFPEWAVSVGGPGGVMPGEESNATMLLEPGPYALACWVPDPSGKPHLMSGMLQPAEVVAGGETVPAAQPKADVTVSLTEYDFEFTPVLAPGAHTIRVDNNGSQAHEIQVWRLAPGKSVEDFMAYLEKNLQGDPPGGWIGGVSELEAGDHAYFTASLEAGEYALICFVTDEKDGKPHFAHGMLKQITVGEGAAAVSS